MLYCRRMAEPLLRRAFWRNVGFRWSGALCWERGAAMAFFALFSVAPLFILLLSFLDRLFGVGTVRGEVYTTLVRLFGSATADALRALLLQPNLFQGTWATVGVNVLLTAIGSAALFRHMQRCLEVLWQRSEPDGGRASVFFRSFFRSFFALGTLAVFVVGGLFALAGAVLVGPLFKQAVFGQDIPPLWPWVSATFALLGTVGVFGVLYATLAPERPSLRRLGSACAVSCVLLLFAKAVAASFAQSKTVFSLFGAGSAVVYLLLWCFLLAQIFLFAATVAAVRTETP